MDYEKAFAKALDTAEELERKFDESKLDSLIGFCRRNGIAFYYDDDSNAICIEDNWFWF